MTLLNLMLLFFTDVPVVLFGLAMVCDTVMIVAVIYFGLTHV